MKKFILSLLIVAAGIFTTSINAQVETGAKIEFAKEIHDYGNIKYEANGTSTFEFTNTGTESLIISDVKRSCGCTAPTWPREPIAPGETSKIVLKYDTKRAGGFLKSVTITSNAINEPVKIIKIKGTVGAAPSKATPTNTNGPVK